MAYYLSKKDWAPPHLVESLLHRWRKSVSFAQHSGQGIRVTNLVSDLQVQYPFTVVDYFDAERYGVGETVPKSGEATVWLAKPLPSSQCP